MSNGWLTIVTSLELEWSMPFFWSAAKSSGSLPQHQTPTFFPFIFAIVLMPLERQVSSVIPERAKTCAIDTRFDPFSLVAKRFGSQSRPNSAALPATTVSGVMLGPPTLIVTSRPALS